MEVREQTLPIARIQRVLWCAWGLILAMSVAGQFSKYFLGHDTLKGLVVLTYVDYERNIPAYFSVCLLFLASMTLLFITLQQRQRKRPHVSKWATLCAGMLFMSYDEGFQVHENWTTPTREMLGGDEWGIWHFAWVIPGMIIVGVLGLFFLRFLILLPKATRNRFLVAGTLFVVGSCFVDIAGGYYTEQCCMEHWNYSLLATLEEGMEMAGIITFIGACLLYARESFGDLRIRL